MDSENDFLTAEFLYILLFASKNLLIYPFTYASKLDVLKQVLEPIFKIEEFDINNINTAEIFQLYCSNVANVVPQVDDTTITIKKPLIIFEKGLGDFYPEIAKYPTLQYISLEKSNTFSDRISTDIFVFNKKLHEFAQFEIENKSKKDKNAFDYCRFLITESNFKTSLPAFVKKTIELVKLLNDFSLLQYSHFVDSMNEIELDACILFCERYFNLNPAAILPNETAFKEHLKAFRSVSYNNDLALLEQSEKEIVQIPENRISSLPTASKEIPGNQDQPPEIIKAKQPLIEQALENSENSKDFEDSALEPPNDYTFFLELAKLRENPEIYIIFEHQLSLVRNTELSTTPESKYEALRKSLWKEGIPYEFLMQLLHQYILQLAKVNPQRFMGLQLEAAVKNEYDKVLQLFMNCDIDDRFTKYDICKDQLMKIFFANKTPPESIEPQLLPVYNSNQPNNSIKPEKFKRSSNKKTEPKETFDKFGVDINKNTPTGYAAYFERIVKKYPKINAETIRSLINETDNLLKRLRI